MKLPWWPHLHYYWIHLITNVNFFAIFSFHNLFQLSQSFSIITIFFNYYNFFQLLQSFLIITIFFNNHDLVQLLQFFSIITILFKNHNIFNYHNLWYYFCENNSKYKFHHLTHIFYRQNMTKIFCQFHKFLIYAFYFEFFSFCV